MSESVRALSEAATRAIEEQVHPANWSYWVRLVLMAGPARDFIELASPTAIRALIESGEPASGPGCTCQRTASGFGTNPDCPVHRPASESTEHVHRWETWDIDDNDYHHSKVVCPDHNPPLVRASLPAPALSPEPDDRGDTMSAETIDSLGTEVTRTDPREYRREYRKVAIVKAGQAIRGGVMATLEGDHTFEAGDYICGPGAGGEFWPVKRAIFEATYVPAGPHTESPTETPGLRATVDPLYGTGEFDKEARRAVRDAMQRAAERNTRGRVYVTDADVHSLLFELRSEGLAVDTGKVRAALGESVSPEPGSLDAAWKEAEAAGVEGLWLSRYHDSETTFVYDVSAKMPNSPLGHGPTFAAALLDLVAKLRPVR
jgi:hypothetical protein